MASKIISVIIEDHSRDVLEALKYKIENAMMSIGQEAEGYAKDDCPVDTGRLRNSITCATKTFHSNGNDRWDKGATESATSDDMSTKATPEDNTVYIGSNVDYAIYQEYGDYNHKTGKKHFLRDSVANHGDHYKAILEASLKS